MDEPLTEEQKQKLEELAKTPIRLTVPAGALNLLLQYLSFCAECNPPVVPRTDKTGNRQPERDALYYGNLRDLIQMIDTWYGEMQRQMAEAGGSAEILKASSDRIQ